MASRNKKRPFMVDGGAAEVAREASQGAALTGGQNSAFVGRRGSREQRQDAAVGVDIGQLRDYKINKFRGIEPMTVTPPAVENYGDEGERRVQVTQRGVGDALKKFQ